MSDSPHTEDSSILSQYPSWNLKKLRNLRLNPLHIVAGNGFIRKGASCLVTGGTGIGKSVMVEQWAICLAAGLPLLGKIAVPRKCRVLYMGSQNDPETLKRDCAAISNSLGVKDADVGDRLDMRYVPGLTSKAFFAFLEEALTTLKFEVVIADPYQDYIGDASVNDDEKFFKWRREVDALITKYHCAFVTLPHTRKPSKRDSLTDREQVSLASGTMAIGNWCRTACELIHHSDDKNYCLHFSKNAERSGLLGPDGSPLRELYVEHSENQNEPWWKARDSQLPPVRVNTEAEVLKAAYANPEKSYREISDMTGISKSTVERMYPKALKIGKIKVKMNAKKGGALSGSREAPDRSAPVYRSAPPSSSKSRRDKNAKE